MRLAPTILGLAVIAGCNSSNSEPGKKGRSLDSREIPGAVAVGSNQQHGPAKAPGLLDSGPPKKNLTAGETPGVIGPHSNKANDQKTAPSPVAKFTDAEFTQILIGLWDERVKQEDQNFLERQLMLLESGAMIVRASIRSLQDNQIQFFVTGTWRVADGRLLLDVQTTSAPHLVPIGTKSADVLLSAGATEFSYHDSASKKTRILRRSASKLDPAQAQREVDAEMERILRGGTWGDEHKLSNGTVAVRRISFELRGEFNAVIRYHPSKTPPVMISGSWQVTSGTLHIVVKTSTQPQIIAVSAKTSDKIRIVNASEFTYVDAVTRLKRVVRRESD
jgi:hypothetical protein